MRVELTWADLVATALVGTDRRPVPEPSESAGSAARAKSTVEPARAVLEEAAAWSLRRRAGRRSTAGVAEPTPAAPETRPIVPAAAAARLASLLDASSTMDGMTRAALVPEWLRTAAARELRLPPEILPEVLDLGRRDTSLRPAIVATGGARAGWLATLNPDWTYLTGTTDTTVADDESAWHTGSRGQRAGYLHAARQRDPDTARARLTTDWPTLAPDERAHLLAVLETGLGPGDEPLLETALDDRRKEVRSVAAELLAALPGSAYNARMVTRTRACLTVVGQDLLVEPPDACDPAMRRDGIVPKPPKGVGERAWWLEQVLARTPPTAALGAPDAFLSLSIVDDWEPVVLPGLAQAAGTHRDAPWAVALLDRLEPSLRSTGGRYGLLEALYRAVPPDEVVRRATRAVETVTNPDAARALERLLLQCPGPWPDDLAQAVLRTLESGARARPPWLNLDALCRLAAINLPPDRHPEATALAQRLWADQPDDHRGHLFDRLAATLRLRHEMTEELR